MNNHTYQIYGNAIYLLEYGTIVPKTSIQMVTHIVQEDNNSILRLFITGASPLDIKISQTQIKIVLQEIFYWLGTENIQELANMAKNNESPQNLEKDDFGLPAEPQTQEELDMILKSVSSHKDTMNTFNRPLDNQLKEQILSNNEPDKKVFPQHMFDLSD